MVDDIFQHVFVESRHAEERRERKKRNERPSWANAAARWQPSTDEFDHSYGSTPSRTFVFWRMVVHVCVCKMYIYMKLNMKPEAMRAKNPFHKENYELGVR